MNQKKRSSKKSGNDGSRPNQAGAPRRAPSTRSRVAKALKKSTKSVLARKNTSQNSAKGATENRTDNSEKKKQKKGPPSQTPPARRPTQKRSPTTTSPESSSPTLSKPPRRKTNSSSLPSAREQKEEEESPPASLPDDDPYPISPYDMSMLGIGSRVFPPNIELNLNTDLEGDEDIDRSFLEDDPNVQMRIRELEERLDGLMASVPQDTLGLDSDEKPDAVDEKSETTELEVEAAIAETAEDAAQELLESDYYKKNWGQGSLRENSQDVDEFGRDPDYEERLRPALEFLFKKYFRVDVQGIENVPDHGRAVIVANHSGALPFDGVMLREAIRLKHSTREDLRWLAEDFSFYLPFLGVTLNRIGAVRACPENAARLLSKEHLVGVFPEGAEGAKKLYKDRYQLQRFGRGGFIRLCLRTGSPIIPCAVIGAEETNPIIYRFDNLFKLLGLDYLPITPTFPFLGPLGLIPAPSKWKIIFGEPISLDEYGPQAAEDHVLVGKLSEQVRLKISELVDTALRRRKSIWL